MAARSAMRNLLLYYITDRTQFAGGELQRRRRLLERIAEAARHGVNYVQLREKDLSARELEILAREAVDAIFLRGENPSPATANPLQYSAPHGPRTRLLINSRSDIACSTGADGVHLRADDISPSEARSIWRRWSAGAPFGESPEAKPIVAVSCHTQDEVAAAAANGADIAVFGPVFEKRGGTGVIPAGLDALHQACRYKIPVLALGGVTLENAGECLNAGAAGIAAIRLFQENGIDEVMRALRRE